MNASKEILIFENVFSITVMHLLKRLLIVLLFATLIPTGIRAQEKKGDIDFNIGISTPGFYSLADIDEFKNPREMYYYNYTIDLGGLETESYNSTLYPSISSEITYKLADSGFFKRLSLAGYVGFHMADYQNIDMVSDSKGTKETAMKLDVLLGIRYHIINGRYFNMYSQAFLGGEIKNDCKYWDITGDMMYSGKLGENDIRWHITILGFRVKLGHSNIGLMTELGYGSEYCASVVPIIPGIRCAVSYRF